MFGGKNKVSMQRLRELCREIGLRNVLTHGNTGNIICYGLRERVADQLRNIIIEELRVCVDVVVLSALRWQEITRVLPSEWVTDSAMRTEVMFCVGEERIDIPEGERVLTD